MDVRQRVRAASLALLALAGTFVGGCSTIAGPDRELARNSADEYADASLRQFLAADPTIGPAIEAAPGYLVCDTSTLILGPLGHASGVCVLQNRDSGARTYLDVSAVEIGAGLGSADATVLAVIKSREVLDQIERGRWTLKPTLSSASGERGGMATWTGDAMDVHVLGDSGALLGAGLEWRNFRVNEQLTDTGLAIASVPNGDPSRVSSRGDDAPRQWNRALPFMAQQVIDRGFDLPNPYGAGLAWASVDQDMRLTNLSVGFNGSEKQPFEWVSFDNAVTDLATSQLKLDAWVLPFLNVFALLGKVRGDIHIDVLLDGDGLLEQRGTDCDRVVEPPACRILEGRQFVLPIRAPVEPLTYGLGTVLAGGWNGWFATVPVNVTWSKPRGAVLDGRSLTVTPRGGRIVNLDHLGRLSLFVGGNYLDSENTADGVFVVPGTEFEIDYLIDQANLDPWNLVAGFNWDVSPRLSWSAEYNGFTGTREAFVSSLTVRF